MDGSNQWQTVSAPMSGWEIVQAVASVTKKRTATNSPIEDYRIEVHSDGD